MNYILFFFFILVEKRTNFERISRLIGANNLWIFQKFLILLYYKVNYFYTNILFYFILFDLFLFYFICIPFHFTLKYELLFVERRAKKFRGNTVTLKRDERFRRLLNHYSNLLQSELLTSRWPLSSSIALRYNRNHSAAICLPLDVPIEVKIVAWNQKPQFLLTFAPRTLCFRGQEAETL